MTWAQPSEFEDQLDGVRTSMYESCAAKPPFAKTRFRGKLEVYQRLLTA